MNRLQPNASEVIASTSADAGALACEKFAACCPELPSDVQTSCMRLASMATGAVCRSELQALQRAGNCRNIDAGPLDSGAPAEASTSRDGGAAKTPAAACILVGGCCASPVLPPSDLPMCEAIASENGESGCADFLDSISVGAVCGGASSSGPGGACPELAQCCTNQAFPAGMASVCATTASAGDDTPCSMALAMFETAGFCGGVVVTADGGITHAQDPSCTMLSTCCSGIMFPASTLTTCQQIVAGNEGGNCLSAYDSYASLAYCE